MRISDWSSDVCSSDLARSNIHLLTTLGARVRLIAPPTLMPSAVERLGVETFTDMRKGLEDCDIVMMLRLQTERMQGSYVPSTREYFHFFGLDREKLQAAKRSEEHTSELQSLMRISYAVFC